MADVLVVGGGPAGLAAASTALARGASVCLLDAGSRLGGQLWRQPVLDAPLFDTPPGTRARASAGRGGVAPGPGGAVGPSLPARYRHLAGHPRLEVLAGRAVWAVASGEGGFVAHLEGGSQRRGVALVLATGASEVAAPFPGWDLPGVVSAGAAQSMLKAHHQLVGRRVVVCGSGPFLLPVAAGLARAGARVVAVLEALPLRQVAATWRPLARRPAKLAEAARYGASLATRRVPLRFGRAVVACEGDGEVEEALVSRVGPGLRPRGALERLAVDAVCVSFGFVPRLELARQLDLAERRHPTGPEVSAAHDGTMASSLPGVFVAGELTGIGGGDLAEAEGVLAGHGAADHCGLPAPPDGALAAARRAYGAARRFANGLDATFDARAGLQLAADDTVVCRCEDVTAGAVRAALAAGARTVRELRSQTRCGMGYCQGRTCGPVLQVAVAEATGRAVGEVGDLHRRPVAVPMPLGEVATGGSSPAGPAPGTRASDDPPA